MLTRLKKLGPGLLFAGAAIGVSHLVQSTRAGADFGWGLIWVLLLVNLFKYPFFQFGPRYALATGESLLDGYYKLGKIYLWIYFFLNMATMFTIQTAVTIVTAGLASNLFDVDTEIIYCSIGVTAFCYSILLIGRYQLLDKVIKAIVLVLTISSILALMIASSKGNASLEFTQVFPEGAGLLFVIAFMGWMPAPMDISIWHSIWVLEKKNDLKNKLSLKEGLFDFNIGYLTTVVLGVCFVGLGALVMFGSDLEFSNKGNEFAGQLIELYTSNLGENWYSVIAVAALTTMISTTITTLDASPRAMSKTVQLLFQQKNKDYYMLWITILALGTCLIFLFLLSEMGLLVQIATVLSFITAPFYAILNYRLITSKHMPTKDHPSHKIKILSLLGIIFLIGFTGVYLLSL
ncbi:MAG: divalent metal cation transporter [Flavobacteriaceae bacterium TMED42]|nr:MAG: divalent metal cation transporter [Flavobacteriaceae bacterium TMED42]